MGNFSFYISLKKQGFLSGFDDSYETGKTIGVGTFSTVKEVKNKEGSKYAAKAMIKSELTNRTKRLILNEVTILNSLSHSNIIKLFCAYDEPEAYYIVTELIHGGPLLHRIMKKKYYREKEARDVCKILFETIGFCHARDTVHRDLKPDNLMLIGQSDTQLKVIDFGFAKQVRKSSGLKTKCGTPGFTAPEVLSGVPYSSKADMWSIGVIIYILLCGYEPFEGTNKKEVICSSIEGKYSFDDGWGKISENAKNLINGLLEANPDKRLSAEDALKHEWIRTDTNLDRLDKGIDLERLRYFLSKRKFNSEWYDDCVEIMSNTPVFASRKSKSELYDESFTNREHRHSFRARRYSFQRCSVGSVVA